MSTKQTAEKIQINSKLHPDKIHIWHRYAVDNRLTKEEALAELIVKGAKRESKTAV